MTLQELAKNSLSYFEIKERVDKKIVYSFKKNTPEWVRDLVYESFPEFFPDDFIFKNIYFLLDQISKGEETNLTPSIYTQELKDWAFGSTHRIASCNFLLQSERKFQSISEIFKLAQQQELDEIQTSVISCLLERLDVENENG